MPNNNDAATIRIPSRQSLRALDCLNLFIGDVIGGLGPYLAVYLKITRGWDQAAIGTALSAMGIATIFTQIPGGTFIDRIKQKRLLLSISALLMGLSCIALTQFGQFKAVLTAQITYGIAAALAGPCIVAISLGIVGHKKFATRIARNEAFNHIGNVIAALLAGISGYLISSEWIFYLIALLSFASIIATSFIKENDIDHQIAIRNNSSGGTKDLSSVLTILTDRRVLVFAISVMLFHLANAAMLPLAGQYLSEGRAHQAPIWISACIIAAQLVMIPTCVLAGRLAQKWGRKPVFLLGFAALPIRGFLYILSNSPWLVLSVQILDGIASGIFGVLVSVIVADITEKTGYYNTTRGFIITAQGIGAALSNVLAGYIVHRAGYNAGFASLSVIAIIGIIVCYFGLKETMIKD